MGTELDGQMSHLLRKAAENETSENEFYAYFRSWYARTDSSIKDIIFKEIEHYWADNHFPRAPKNIIENNCVRLRLLARALDEKWDSERTEHEIAQY